MKDWYDEWCDSSKRTLGQWPLYVFGARDDIRCLSNIGFKSLAGESSLVLLRILQCDSQRPAELERCDHEIEENGSSKTLLKIIELIDMANIRLGCAHVAVL